MCVDGVFFVRFWGGGYANNMHLHVFYYSFIEFLIIYLVFQAEAQTDEVFAQVTLLPEPEVR